MTYDSSSRSRRRRTARRDSRPRSGCLGGFIVGVLVTLLTIALSAMAWRWHVERNAEDESVRIGPTVDPLTVSYDCAGEATRWYVVEDPENGVQYIYNDHGGVCRRVTGEAVDYE